MGDFAIFSEASHRLFRGQAGTNHEVDSNFCQQLATFDNLVLVQAVDGEKVWFMSVLRP